MRLFGVWERPASRKAVKQRNRAIFLITLLLFLGIIILGVRFLGSFQAL